ncbi:hypothetical protein LEMLEM_LOCUS15764 [Lemmus lemmus]
MRSLCPLDTWLDKKPPHVLTTHPHHERNNAAAARRLTPKQSCPEDEKKKIPIIRQRDSRALYRHSWQRAGFPELLCQEVSTWDPSFSTRTWLGEAEIEPMNLKSLSEQGGEVPCHQRMRNLSSYRKEELASIHED